MTEFSSIVEYVKGRFLNRDTIFVTIVVIVAGILLFTCNKTQPEGSTPAIASIVQVKDHSTLIGPVRIGKQDVTARILSNPYKGQEIVIINELVGYVLTDRYVKPGDRAVLMLDIKNGTVQRAKIVDFDRQRWHLALFCTFAVSLILFARSTGIRAFVSFLFTVIILIKFLFPAILQGYDPLLVCLSCAIIFGIITLLLVGGFNIRSFAAIIGFIAGILLSAGLTMFAGNGMFLRGITCDWAVFLLQSGYPGLDLTKILLGSIVLGASGAMIDVAISVATAVREVARANSSLGARSLIRSGFEVGRTELGTMTTTLLLAYMGVNIFLVLMFTAKGTPPETLFNISMISHEILRALVGCIGMVLIAPITAVAAGLLYHRANSSVLPHTANSQRG